MQSTMPSSSCNNISRPVLLYVNSAPCISTHHCLFSQAGKGKENHEPQQQQQQNPWYSLLSCRLLSFIGGGGPGAATDHEEVKTAVHPVISSHRLSAERRFSESSLHSIRCEHLL